MDGIIWVSHPPEEDGYYYLMDIYRYSKVISIVYIDWFSLSVKRIGVSTVELYNKETMLRSEKKIEIPNGSELTNRN